MQVISKETPDTSAISECEHCHHLAPGRRVEAIDAAHRGTRGWYFLCYKCFGPRIFWRPSWNSTRTVESPLTL